MDDSYQNNDRPFRPRYRDAGGRQDDVNRDSNRYGGERRSYGGGGDRRRNDVRDEIYSTQVRAGKRRYFFDVRDTQSGDFYLTITEMKRAFDGGPAEKHKVFLYKEDFTKFIRGLQDTIDYVKSNLLTADQLDELERGDAQYEEDERYYREQRQQRAAEGYSNGPATDGYDANRRSPGTWSGHDSAPAADPHAEYDDQ
jgi:Protein of unknown function (DUF3276)